MTAPLDCATGPLEPPVTGRSEAVRLAIGDPRARLSEDQLAHLDAVWRSLLDHYLHALVMRLPNELAVRAEDMLAGAAGCLMREASEAKALVAPVLLANLDAARVTPAGRWLEQRLADDDPDVAAQALALVVARRSRLGADGMTGVDFDDMAIEAHRILAQAAHDSLLSSLGATPTEEAMSWHALDALIRDHHPESSLCEAERRMAQALHRSPDHDPRTTLVELAEDGEFALFAELAGLVGKVADPRRLLAEEGGLRVATLFCRCDLGSNEVKAIGSCFAAPFHWGDETALGETSARMMSGSNEPPVREPSASPNENGHVAA